MDTTYIYRYGYVYALRLLKVPIGCALLLTHSPCWKQNPDTLLPGFWTASLRRCRSTFRWADQLPRRESIAKCFPTSSSLSGQWERDRKLLTPEFELNIELTAKKNENALLTTFFPWLILRFRACSEENKAALNSARQLNSQLISGLKLRHKRYTEARRPYISGTFANERSQICQRYIYIFAWNPDSEVHTHKYTTNLCKRNYYFLFKKNPFNGVSFAETAPWRWRSTKKRSLRMSTWSTVWNPRKTDHLSSTKSSTASNSYVPSRCAMPFRAEH